MTGTSEPRPFWTPENLGDRVFEVARWLDDLSTTSVPAPPSMDEEEASTRPGGAARLLFVLDNDYGELATVMYLLLGQRLVHQATVLLPDRLHAHKTDAIPGRTHRYGSLEDVLGAVDRVQPSLVFLCSGYLLSAHRIFALEQLERLLQQLRARGVGIVTTDPFLGMLSDRDPRSWLRIDEPRAVEEQMWSHFARVEQIFRDTVHLYPAHVPRRGDGAADARHVSFFNASLILPRPDPAETTSLPTDALRRPLWLFVLARADYETQRRLVGEAAFVDILVHRLMETRRANRHAILIGPDPLIEALTARMPAAQGVDLVRYRPFSQFASLLLGAEHAFYWNAVSHSLLIRLFNELPIVLFDRGHLLRSADALYDRVVQSYYQGHAPLFRDHRQPLTPETVAAWADDDRGAGRARSDGFQRAPTPEQLIATLVSGPR